MDSAMTIEFKVELANGKNGNLYGVGRYINGCRNTWALAPQESKTLAYDYCTAWNLNVRYAAMKAEDARRAAVR